MSYQIAKGWPAEGALDEVLTPATGVTLVGGTIAAINATGEAVVADYDSAGADADLTPAFVIDHDNVTGKVTALMSRCIIECDDDHYAADTYLPNAGLTAIGGKFAAPAGSEPVIAKVISYNATTGKMRVLWQG